VELHVHAEHVEVWYAGQCVERLPRLRGRGKHCVDYRHVIDSLVRKPGAFEQYRYREDLFPTSRFRLAYDALRQQHTARMAAEQYVQVLQLAAREGEALVDDALRLLLDEGQSVTAAIVRSSLGCLEEIPAAMQVTVEVTDLQCFDELLPRKEVWDAQGTQET